MGVVKNTLKPGNGKKMFFTFIYLFCATSSYLLQLCKGEKKPKKGMTCTVHYTGNLMLLFLIS
jgi:hypothetical protein